MDLIGYIATMLIGIILGLIGGGGSILHVPVLVYLFQLTPMVATGYSLFVVGFSSGVGAISYLRQGLVHRAIALRFGVPSIMMVLLTRRYVVPMIPAELQLTEQLLIRSDVLQMVLFAILMVFASVAMIRRRKEEASVHKTYVWMLPVQGMLVGLLTGLVGAGGGFLIIPALLMLGKLSIKEAVGTSLVIIAANSLIGFLGQQDQLDIDWIFLILLNTLSSIGIILGTYLSKFVSANRLKPAFGYFILFMGIYILWKELYI